MTVFEQVSEQAHWMPACRDALLGHVIKAQAIDNADQTIRDILNAYLRANGIYGP